MKYGLTVCCVGDLNLETVISDFYNRVWNGIRFELHWGWADCRFLKRKRYNFLFSWERRMDWFRYLTGFLSKSSYLVIKVACMDMMFLTPAFIRKTTGPAFLDQIQPFFICTSWIFFRHKNSTSVFYLEWDQHRYQKNWSEMVLSAKNWKSYRDTVSPS